MPETKSVQERIIEAFETRLKRILTTNGYQTNLGQKVFVTRVKTIDDSEMPSVVIWDSEVKKDEHTANIHLYSMTVELEIFCSDGENTPDLLRTLIADCDKSIGEDRTFGGLAYHTGPLDDSKYFDQSNKLIGIGIVRYEVKFRVKSYNPYEQP